MNKMLQKLFGASRSAPASKLPASSLDNPPTIEDGSDNAMRRQLVQVLMRDVLRRHGIPSEWIECQMLVVSSTSRGTGLYARLVIRHWDQRLMTYALAFQNALRADIARYEPNASSWLHGISWQLEMDDDCPYTTLPDKAFWQDAPGHHGLGSEAEHDNDASKDLERLFRIRDQELANRESGGHEPVGYEKTQPISL
ncbi:hypothetical protein [Polaromonas sp.]|uniref:hypothetical protein n=1 Tax=Polaromonas sp. TaxID=1869339 RepID=UPI00286B0E76|nr:hypothetical protein [Polaromonas sp.]